MQVQKSEKDVLEAKKTVEKAMSHLAAAVSLLSGFLGEMQSAVPPEWLQQRLKVWYLVQQEGGIVNKDKLHEIAAKVGLDNRGLGGFFVGKGSLTKLPDEKIALTEDASKQLEAYSEWCKEWAKKQGK